MKKTTVADCGCAEISGEEALQLTLFSVSICVISGSFSDYRKP